MKPVIELSERANKEFYYERGCPEKMSKTKLLGGKDNVAMWRWFCYHGYGAWITEWRIKDLAKAKQSILNLGFDYKITKGEEILETNLKEDK